MKDVKLHETITMKCPSGHKLRGNKAMVGKTVRCPRCEVAFVISPPENRKVTDTTVMRILGDSPALPPMPENVREPEQRPCPRCAVSIKKDANVCQHCNCYVGVMPRFMKNMFPDKHAG